MAILQKQQVVKGAFDSFLCRRDSVLTYITGYIMSRGGFLVTLIGVAFDPGSFDSLHIPVALFVPCPKNEIRIQRFLSCLFCKMSFAFVEGIG